MSVKDLGEILCLDSGTLTPLLKKMETKGLITRRRSTEDERSLIVSLTEEGKQLRERAVQVPIQMAQCTPLQPEEAMELYRLLYKILK
jgi:DNA-binding MarR family transcriptional regulator